MVFYCGILIVLSGNKTFRVKKHLCDENGQKLILETLIDDSEFILTNFSMQRVNKFKHLMSSTCYYQAYTLVVKDIIFAGDFNLFLDLCLDPKGGS